LLIKCPIEVPNLGYSLSMWVCLSSGYTMLGLLCRCKYCCSKFINLGTRFAGHSYKKSSKGELLHRLVRLEMGTMEEARYQLQMKRPEMETVRRQSERPENFDTFPS